MTQTPPTVTDELSARLLKALGAAALVELTTVCFNGLPGARIDASVALE